MKLSGRIVIILFLAITIVGVLILKNRQADSQTPPVESTTPKSCCPSKTTAQADPAACKKSQPPVDSKASQQAPDIEKSATVDKPNTLQEAKQLPRLVELGSKKCIPCKMMMPILDELTKDYDGRLKVEFFDVWEQPEIAKKFAIKIIPTQVFLAADGKELFRHEGFYAKEDILAKWKELGINLSGE